MLLSKTHQFTNDYAYQPNWCKKTKYNKKKHEIQSKEKVISTS